MDLTKPYELITDKLTQWYEQIIILLPNFAVAVVVLFLFFLAAKLVKKVVQNLISRVSEDYYIRKFTSNGAYLAVIIAGLLVALNILNLEKTVTSFLAGAGIVGLALGFAFQDMATNLIAGVIMILKKPIKIGDHIEVEGHQGIVQQVSLRTTNIQTFDGQLVLVPNKDVFQGVVKNFSHTASRRVDIPVGVSYADNLEKVIDVLETSLIKLDDIDKDRGIEVFYTDFGGSSINLTVRFWLPKGQQAHFLSLRSQAIRKITTVFRENDISIPFPIRTLDFGIGGGEKLSEHLKVLSSK